LHLLLFQSVLIYSHNKCPSAAKFALAPKTQSDRLFHLLVQ